MRKSLKIILSLLVLAICVGSAPMDAKTRSKKKTTKTTHTRSHSKIDGASALEYYNFIDSDGCPSLYDLIDDLISRGFTELPGSNVRKSLGDGYVNATKEVLDGGNVTVTFYSYDEYIFEVELKYATAALASKYVERMKSDGWQYSYTNGNIKIYSLSAGTMSVNGRVVTIFWGE